MTKTFPWQRYGNWLALVGWIGVIFWFSSQPDLKSGLETWQDVVLRKIAHASEYFVLSYFFSRCLAVQGAWRSRHYLAVVIFALAVASVDELYQTTVRGRNGSPMDMFIDVVGAAAFTSLHRFARTSKNSYTL